MISEAEKSVFANEFAKHNGETIKFSAGQMIYWYFKRLADILISLLGIIVMILPTLVIAVFIKKDSKGPVFYKQNRLGRNGNEFKIYKFRTMDNANKNSVTRVGTILRKTSIDELPQLINILKGDMSFVGPRPLVLNESNVHTTRINNDVYKVRPGITGLAQINGRDIINDEQKVKYDIEYVKHFGLLLDIKLFFVTIPKTFTEADIVEGVHTHSQ